jgi:hypothetical protein
MDSLKGHFGSSDLRVFVKELVKRAQNGVLVIADAGPFFISIRQISLLNTSCQCHPSLI